jgi:hypothetical protein
VAFVAVDGAFPQEALMLPRPRWLLVPALLAVGWLGLVASAGAVYPPPIKDEAKLFSAEALDKANKRIKEIYAHARKDLVIETYAAVPEGKKVPEDKNKKEEFFAEWASARVKDLGVNGVYVLICKSPTYLYIEADNLTRKRAFTGKDRAALQRKLIDSFRDKKFDEGLKEGIEVVEAAYRANLK